MVTRHRFAIMGFTDCGKSMQLNSDGLSSFNQFIHSVSLKHKTARQHSAILHILICVGETLVWPRWETKTQNRAKCPWRHNLSHSSITVFPLWCGWIWIGSCVVSVKQRVFQAFALQSQSIASLAQDQHLLSLNWSSKSFKLTLSAFCARLCVTWKAHQCAAEVCRLVL